MKSLLLILLLIGTAHADIIATPPPVPSPLPNPFTDPSTLLHKAMNTLYYSNRTAVMNAYNYVWNNKSGLTGAAIYTALGTDCVRFHQLFTREAGVVNYGIPGTIKAEPKTVTENVSDGTCTVGQ